MYAKSVISKKKPLDKPCLKSCSRYAVQADDMAPWASSTSPDNKLGWTNVDPTSVLSSRRWANVNPA